MSRYPSHTCCRLSAAAGKAVLVAMVAALVGCTVPPFRYVPGLGRAPDASMEAILQEALNDRNPVVRLDAIRLLGTMTTTPEQQARSAAALSRALNDEDENTRVEVVRALGNMSPDVSGPYLRRAMKDESVRVRIQVVQVLRRNFQNTQGPLSDITGN